MCYSINNPMDKCLYYSIIHFCLLLKISAKTTAEWSEFGPYSECKCLDERFFGRLRVRRCYFPSPPNGNECEGDPLEMSVCNQPFNCKNKIIMTPSKREIPTDGIKKNDKSANCLVTQLYTIDLGKTRSLGTIDIWLKRGDALEHTVTIKNGDTNIPCTDVKVNSGYGEGECYITAQSVIVASASDICLCEIQLWEFVFTHDAISIHHSLKKQYQGHLVFHSNDMIWCNVRSNNFDSILWETKDMDKNGIEVYFSVLWIKKPQRSKMHTYRCTITKNNVKIFKELTFIVFAIQGSPQRADSVAKGRFECLPGLDLSVMHHFKTIELKYLTGPAPAVNTRGRFAFMSGLPIGEYQISCMALSPGPVSSGKQGVIKFKYFDCLKNLTSTIRLNGSSINNGWFRDNDTVSCISNCTSEKFHITLARALSGPPFYWTRDGISSIKLTNQHNHVFYVAKCTSRSASYNRYSEIPLYVKVAPFDVTIEPYKLITRCIAKGYPPPVIKWTSSATTVVNVMDNNILLNDEDTEHEIKYVCTATNEVGSQNVSFILKPDINTIPTKEIIDEDINSWTFQQMAYLRLAAMLTTSAIMVLSVICHFKFFVNYDPYVNTNTNTN